MLIDINGNTLETSQEQRFEAIADEINKNRKVIDSGSKPKEAVNQNDPKQIYSFVNKEEEEGAVKLIRSHLDELGFPTNFLPPVRERIIVKIYVDPKDVEFLDENGQKKALYVVRDKLDKNKSWVGLVISMGPQAGRGWRYEENYFVTFLRRFFNKWMPKRTKYPPCKVGDWVLFHKTDGIQVNYLGTPIQYIRDDCIEHVVADPRHISRF